MPHSPVGDKDNIGFSMKKFSKEYSKQMQEKEFDKDTVHAYNRVLEIIADAERAVIHSFCNTPVLAESKVAAQAEKSLRLLYDYFELKRQRVLKNSKYYLGQSQVTQVTPSDADTTMVIETSSDEK